METGECGTGGDGSVHGKGGFQGVCVCVSERDTQKH